MIREPEQAPLDRSKAQMRQPLGRAMSRGRLAQEELDAMLGRITWTTELNELAAADAAIEAVTEDPSVKGKTFRQLDELLPDAAFLASNTSSIPIAQLGSWTQRADRVLGLHFFSPVPVMSLVEVVIGYRTDLGVVAEAEAFAQTIGK